MRSRTGVNRIRWGSDYPAVRLVAVRERGPAVDWTFKGVDETELRMMLGGQAMACYGLDEIASGSGLLRSAPLSRS